MMAKPMKTLELHYPMIQLLIKYIPQEGGIETVCRAVENFYGDDTPIPTLSLKYTEPPWAQRWRSLLRTSLWRQPGGGGYSLIRGYWGCAAGWGRVFRVGLTIMGLHF